MLNMWKGAQTDLAHVVSNFILALENGQKETGIDGLNNLITALKDLVPAGRYFHL